MSATIVNPELSLMVSQATPEQQQSLLKWLLAKVIAEQGPEPHALTGDNGVPLGVFVPNPDFRNKPPMSEEQYSELLKVIQNTKEDQLRTGDQLIQELELEIGRASCRETGWEHG